MVQFSNNLTIYSEINDVFKFLGKLENFPAWNYSAREITEVYSNGNKVGSQYHLTRELGPQNSEIITIKDYIQNIRLSLEAMGNLFSYTSTYELAQHTRGTSIINSIELQLSGVNHIAFNDVHRNLKSAENRNLNVLKRMIEKKHPLY